MGRGRSVLVGFLLLVCTSPSCEGSGTKRKRYKPDLPEHIDADSYLCHSCGEGRHVQGCVHEMRHACPDGEGSCATPVPCDAACCPAPQTQAVGLEEPPWGPVLAAADSRRPTGAIAFHRNADLYALAPGGSAMDDPAPLLRLPQPIGAWRWSAAHQQIVFSTERERRLHRFDLATRTSSPVLDTEVNADSFDVTTSGDRVVVVTTDYRSHVSELLLLSLGDGSQDRWRLALGDVRLPAWDPAGARIALLLSLGTERLRIVDPGARTIVDSPRDLSWVQQPTWHPSGSFLVAWRESSGRCVLELIEPDGVRHAETPLAVEREGYDCPAIAFAPDGQHLALQLWSEDRQFGRIEIVSLANMSERTVLTKSGSHRLRELTWLDDAAANALAEHAGFVAPCKACRLDPAEPRSPIAAQPLAKLSFAALIDGYAGQPRPDGLLAYVDVVDDRPQIHVIPAKGGVARALSDPEVGAEGPVFSPDGRGLAFVTRDRRQLVLIDLAEQHVYKPATLTTLRLGIPEWSHDGWSLAAAAINEEMTAQPTKVWTWSFGHGHWGTLVSSGTDLRGSLDARPSWASSGLLVHGREQLYDRLSLRRAGEREPSKLGEDLPRMIAPRWHPSGRFFAAWVGGAGQYQLAWVEADGRAWTATGLRYQGPGEPAAIAFAPDGSHFAFARPDAEQGGMTIEVAAIVTPQASEIVVRTSADSGDISWSVPAAAKHVAAATLPYDWAKPAPKARKPKPSWGNELDTVVVACGRAHPVAIGGKVGLKTTSVGATGAITEATVTGELAGTSFAACLERGAKRVGFDPFVEAEYTFTYQFRVTESGTGSGL